MLQNSDSLNCVSEKGMWMFSVFHKLEECYVFKGVVNIGGENELTVMF